MTGPGGFRLTQYARGGGCACKIPPGELDETIGRLMPDGPGADLLVGVGHGDDRAVGRGSPALAETGTADPAALLPVWSRQPGPSRSLTQPDSTGGPHRLAPSTGQ